MKRKIVSPVELERRWRQVAIGNTVAAAFAVTLAAPYTTLLVVMLVGVFMVVCVAVTWNLYRRFRAIAKRVRSN